MQTLLLSALASVFLLSATSPNPAAAVYKDADLHFSFSYPSDMVSKGLGQAVADSVKENQDDGPIKKALSCITVPMMAIDPGGDRGMLMIIEVDLGCIKAPISAAMLEPLAKGSLDKGLATAGKPVLGEAQSYKLDGHDALYLPASAMNDAGVTKYYGGAACVLIDKTVACWDAMGPNKSEIAKSLANPITFDGHTAQPLVPGTIFTK